MSNPKPDRKHTDNCGRTGNPRVGAPNCKMDCACWCHKPDPLLEAAKSVLKNVERYFLDYQKFPKPVDVAADIRFSLKWDAHEERERKVEELCRLAEKWNKNSRAYKLARELSGKGD